MENNIYCLIHKISFKTTKTFFPSLYWKSSTNDEHLQINVTDKSMSSEFSCEECDYKSHGKRSFKKHVKAVHLVHHKCNSCKYDAVNDVNLTKHVKTHHEDVEIEKSKKRKLSNDNLPSMKKSK